MSLTETTLSDFQQPDPEPETEPELEIDDTTEHELVVPEWATNNDWETNHQCGRCDASVSPRYHAFHRDEDGVLRRCPNCRDISQTNMMNGAGAVDDYERRGRDDEGDQTPTDSLFGSTDTSDLPDYMKGGGN